jgi:hypothetical protein
MESGIDFKKVIKNTLMDVFLGKQRYRYIASVERLDTTFLYIIKWIT